MEIINLAKSFPMFRQNCAIYKAVLPGLIAAKKDIKDCLEMVIITDVVA